MFLHICSSDVFCKEQLQNPLLVCGYRINESDLLNANVINTKEFTYSMKKATGHPQRVSNKVLIKIKV